jgi:hypothetical protein
MRIRAQRLLKLIYAGAKKKSVPDRSPCFLAPVQHLRAQRLFAVQTVREFMYKPFSPPGTAQRTLMDKLRVRVRWYHIPLAVSAFVFWFYLITVITSLLVPLDVTIYGDSQIEFTGEMPGRRIKN